MTLTKVGVVLRLSPPPNMQDFSHSRNKATTFNCYQTHILSSGGELPLWIFHSLNESSTSNRYQTHILSQGGELPLWIFHSLNESTTSSWYQTHILSEGGELPLWIFHSLNESITCKLNTSKTKFRNWLLTNHIAEQLPELAASWPQFCLRTVCGS